MKILLIGGTGLVGSYLLPRLVEDDHEVFALTRSPANIQGLNQAGAKPLTGDIRDPGTFLDRIPGKPGLIVLLAMPSLVPGKRITKKRKAELCRETNDFFRNSMDLALHFGIPVILPGGTSYRTKADEIADETWPIRRAGLMEIGAGTDRMVNEALRTGKPGVIQLLYGRIYGNGGLFRFMYDMIEKGRFRIIGSGKNYIPNVHAGDAAAAIMQAIRRMPLGEKFIISDDAPVTQKEFVLTMAAYMERKAPGHLPAFLVRLAMGKDILEVLGMDCRVSNEKAKRMLEWQPRYPSCREGLAAAIKEIMENTQPKTYST